MITIKRYESDLLLSNMYVVAEGTHAVVIDPFPDITLANGLVIDKILLTHEHYDHISGVNLWKEITKASVLCSRACADNITSPRKNLSKHFKEFCELQTWIELENIPQSDPEYSCGADEVFEDELVFKWQGHKWYLFEMPGHSQGSIGILLDDTFLFSGDSLMENCGIELRLPGGSRKKWKELGEPRLRQIPYGIRVYPGHFKDFIYHKERSELIGVPI